MEMIRVIKHKSRLGITIISWLLQAQLSCFC